ncbi:winged helix-turn-helix domain-containing protein [Lutibacter citreus]|uniref:winged helix-turn-helix domain-containing protein n=1 Tax=Lutibacter citreus TaxID=2138210 RepID=UPI000DBEA940|nr:winged helix-turn-helix domain-containing protein [Lutibacter citreus]
MKKPLDITLIESCLKKICGDRMFEKSPRNVRLLKFLVECSNLGKDVNEYVIGFELFEKNYEPHKNDSKVRVYMYNLRKKLKEYYTTEGKNDPLVFKLEKGQYNLSFEKRDSSSYCEESKPKYFVNKIITKNRIIGLFSILAIVFGSVYFTSLLKEDMYLWNDFFKSEKNICIMADQIIVWHTLGNKLAPTMHKDINNKADYISYLQKHPNDSMRLANYTLFSKMAPFSVKKLTELFVKHKSNFGLRLESNFELDELRDNNLIYIGQLKTMSTSKPIFLKNSKVFRNQSDMYSFVATRENRKIEYKNSLEDGIRLEYALVSFAKLENGKRALFFVSNNDIGVLATVNNFLNKEWLDNFYKGIPKDKKYFNALFEVKGINRTEIECKLVELETLD